MNNRAIGQSPLQGLTPYEKWLTTTTKTDLPKEQHHAIEYIQQSFRKKAINEKLAS